MIQYRLQIGAQEFAVEVAEQTAGTVRVTVNGNPYNVTVRHTAAEGPQAAAAEAFRQPSAETATPEAAGAAPAAAASDGTVLAPIPGLILEVKVRVGEIVRAGQVVVVMEAMKMENNLTAPQSGTVREVLVQKGSEVATGDAILRIGPA